MVCGLCHREDDDHSDSSSGPTRCRYPTHREECPGGFRTNCEDHAKKLQDIAVAPEEDELKSVVDNAQDLPKTDETRSSLILQLQQLVETKSEHKVDNETLLALSNLLKTPTATQAAPGLPMSAPAAFPPPSSSGPSHGSLPPSLLSGLDQLARQHVADNQPFLEVSQDQKHYAGPNMKQIRQDTDTGDKVTKVIDALKNISPVFGQTSSSAPVLPGISPLDQLHQQISNSFHPSAPTQQITSPPQAQNDLLVQLQMLLQGNQRVSPPEPPQTPQPQNVLAQLLSQLQTPRQAPQPAVNTDPNVLLASLVQALGSQQPQTVQPQTNLLPQHLQPTQPSEPIHAQLLAALQPPPTPPSLAQQLASLLQSQGAQAQTSPAYGLLEMPKPRQTTLNEQKPLLQNLQQGMSQARATHVRPTEYSRYCQVEYSDKIKPENTNLVMFSYGYVSQILASRQGQISPMSDAELIGRLQHFLHLMELTAMFTTNQDYSTFAWQRARNYNARIFSDLDHGTLSWPGISTKMDPTSMMQSIEAIPKPEVFKKKDEIKKLAEGGSGSSGPPCPKWNSCEAKGKCSYEVENPGKTCNRPHICSYCFTKLGHTKTNQKESQCKRKEDDNSTSALERLPTS